jgi:hypothetical protein
MKCIILFHAVLLSFVAGRVIGAENCPICEANAVPQLSNPITNQLLTPSDIQKLKANDIKLPITCLDLQNSASIGNDICDKTIRSFDYICECPGATGCDICDDGDTFYEAMPLVDGATCKDAQHVGSLDGGSCSKMRSRHADACCGTEVRSLPLQTKQAVSLNCSICQNGTELPNRNLSKNILGLDGLTCSDVVGLGSLSKKVCDEFAPSFDWYCGCPNVTEPACTACPNGMPVLNPTANLTRLGGLAVTCADADDLAKIRCSDDQKENAEVQAIIIEDCGCALLEDPPTAAPSDSESGSGLSDGAIIGIVFGGFVIGCACFSAAYFNAVG